MSLNAAETARVGQVVETKSAQLGQDAHKDNVQQAARNLFSDNDFRTSSQIPDSDLAREYTRKMTEDLVKQNLLPSVSLSYVGENFDKLDINKTDKKNNAEPDFLTVDEIRAAQNLKPGSIESQLYKSVGDMMENGQLPKKLTKEQLQQKLEEMDKNFQSQDKKNAVDAANVLMDRNLFNDVAQKDGSISREDLKKFLDNPGNASADTIQKLTWLHDNWNDRDVQALTETGPGGARSLTESTIRDGANKLKQDIVVEPGKPVEIGSRIPPKTAWGIDMRPPSADSRDPQHEFYVSDGKGNTVAVDFDGNGRMKYTVGTVDASGNAHYTGWSYEKETGKYVLVDKDQIIAEATHIDFDPSTGNLTPRGLMPRASQQERARQAGAY